MIARLLPALILVLTLARISPAIEFSGIISPSNGAPPVEEFVVLVEHHENRRADNPDSFAVRRQPGKDGRFSVELPKDNKGYMLFITDKSNRTYAGFAHLGASSNFGAIAVQCGGALAGTVQDRDRKPLANMEIILDVRLRAYTCSHYVEAARIRTDAKGAFSFDNLPLGKYRYRPAANAYAVQDGTLDITEDPSFLNLILDKAAWLKGKISDPDGKPVPNINVRINDQSAVSDAQGNYLLGGLTGGTNYVSLSGAGYVQDKKQSYESTRVICVLGREISKDFTVIPAGTLRVTLEPEIQAMPLPATLNISLKNTSGNLSWSDYLDAPLKDRVAVFNNVMPGEFSITIRNEDLPAVSTNATITGGRETRQAIRIPKTCLFKGLVTDEGGKPVGEVKINVCPEKPQTSNEEAESMRFEFDHDREIVSDAQGVFALKGATAGRFRISAKHDDWMPTNRVVDIAGDMDTTSTPLVMTKGKEISGTVTTAEGKPASGQRINLNSVYNPETALSGQQTIYKNTKVGANGAFTFKGLPPGKFRLTVSDSEGNEITSLDNVEAGSDDVIVTLAKTRLITGTVVNSEGKPVQGAAIQAVKSRKRDSDFTYSSISSSRNPLTTDSSGHFEISVREGTAYDILAAAPPLLPQKVMVDLSPGAAAAPVAPLKIVLTQGYKITGSLVSADGKPAGKGLKIRTSKGDRMSMMMARSSDDKSLAAETDARGQFALEGIPPGIITLSVYENLGEDTDQHYPKIIVSKEVLVDTNKMTEVKIVLPKLGSVKGRVMPEEGKKSGVVQVSISSMAGEGRLNYNIQSDARGNFSFTNIPAGKYMAWAYGRGSGRDLSPVPENIEVIADQTVEITLGKKTTGAGAPAFTGTVSRDNIPFQAGEITFMPTPTKKFSKEELMTLYGKMAQGKIGSNGVFSVKIMEPGEYQCMVMPREPGKKQQYDGYNYPKFYQTNVKLSAGQTNLDINFTGVTLSGTVTAPDGSPAVKASIQAIPTNTDLMFQHMAGYHTQTDTQGQYRVECVPPGAYNIMVQHKEYGTTSRKNVTISAASNRVDLALAGGFAITGMVATTSGGSAAGAWVILTTDDELSGGFGSVEEDGTYEMKQLIPKGTYQIFIVLKGQAIEAATLNLTTNTSFNATLVPGGDVRLTVRKQGKPVSGKNALVRTTDGTAVIRTSNTNTRYSEYYASLSPTIAATDENGQTMIRALKPGKYTVLVEGEKASTPVEVKPLDTTEVTLDL